MAGRRPTPTAIKALRGNPGKRPLNRNEPRPAAGAPRPPRHLSREARREWRRLVAVLAPMGVLTVAEADLLAVYAETYARWVEASVALRAQGLIVLSGNGTPMRNPLLIVVENCARTMARCMVELGMTPAARAKLSAPPAEDDPLEKFLNGG